MRPAFPADRRRILMLMSGTEGYGVRRVWEGLIRGFAERGCTITIALLDQTVAETWRREAPGAAIFTAPKQSRAEFKSGGLAKLGGLVRRSVQQVKLSSWLRGVIRRQNIGSVVVQSPLDVTLAGLGALSTGARVFWMMPNAVSDGYPLDLNRRIYRLAFRQLDVMPLANSAYTDATLGAGDFPRRVVHLGTNLDQFRPDAQTSITRADLGVPEQAPLLGLFARLLPEKGQSILIEALAEADPSIHVIICGGPLESEYARAMIARAGELSLAGRIHWLGPKADIVPYYALADVVLNTRVDPEPFGMSIIESMAMQRPVLAHRAGGPQETIVDGTTGWLVDAPTKQAFAAGLARMMADRHRWPEMGLAARAHVETHFSERAMLDRLENAMGLSASTKP